MTPKERASRANRVKGLTMTFDQMVKLEKRIVREITEAILDEREACAKVCEGGSFLHDEALDAKFGKACAAAIRKRT